MHKIFLILSSSIPCCILGSDWSRLQMCGANISGLISRTHETMDGYWPPFRSDDCQMTPSPEELSTAINFVAAMECEKSIQELPSVIESDFDSVRKYLRFYFSDSELRSRVEEKVHYYDYFLHDPTPQTPIVFNPETLEKMRLWYEKRKELQVKEAGMYKNTNVNTRTISQQGIFVPQLPTHSLSREQLDQMVHKKCSSSLV